MATRTSPSPSPPPSAPSQTMIQPGPRATALHKIYTSALTSTLKSNSYENFSSCFPTPAKYCPSALEGVWRQLNTRLQEECVRDFEKILEERNVVEGLNQWDDILDQARVRKGLATDGRGDEKSVHLLSAEELHTAFLGGYLVKVTDELEGKLSESQARNRETMKKIQEQRAEIERFVSGLETTVKDVDGAVKALEAQLGDNGEEIRNDIWNMEKEVAAAK